MQIILVANPGSSSRKYALFTHDLTLLADLHFEHRDNTIIYSLHRAGEETVTDNAHIKDMVQSCAKIHDIFEKHGVLEPDATISGIGLRIVAPGSFFLEHRMIDDYTENELRTLVPFAPLHIDATIKELASLKEYFPSTPIYGISDSAFHRTKPPYAWNYAIKIADADKLDIKRFGYHGLSVAASIDMLWSSGKLPPKVIICHLGSGSSVTAVFHGRSIDTTMGFTPNEGLVMASRSGTVPIDASEALKRGLDFDVEALDSYLNKESGLKGLGGSDDIRTLLEREKNGDHMAHLALTTLIHSIHKSIGGMMTAMNGCDMLVFTGTVGERSAAVRKRVVAHLEYADFIISGDNNDSCLNPESMTFISQETRSKPIIVIPTRESRQLAKHTLKMIKSQVQ